MARRSRFSPSILPQQKTTFSAKTPLSQVLGPFRVARGQVYAPGVVTGQVYIAGTQRGQVYIPGIQKGQVA